MDSTTLSFEEGTTSDFRHPHHIMGGVSLDLFELSSSSMPLDMEQTLEFDSPSSSSHPVACQQNGASSPPFSGKAAQMKTATPHTSPLPNSSPSKGKNYHEDDEELYVAEFDDEEEEDSYGVSSPFTPNSSMLDDDEDWEKQLAFLAELQSPFFQKGVSANEGLPSSSLVSGGGGGVVNGVNGGVVVGGGVNGRGDGKVPNLDKATLDLLLNIPAKEFNVKTRALKLDAATLKRLKADRKRRKNRDAAIRSRSRKETELVDLRTKVEKLMKEKEAQLKIIEDLNRRLQALQEKDLPKC